MTDLAQGRQEGGEGREGRGTRGYKYSGRPILRILSNIVRYRGRPQLLTPGSLRDLKYTRWG